MSYPYDVPSLLMSTCWNSGSYKPTDITRTIRDNYTPVNKNSMTNSVGHEISLIQNYVNKYYLGRSDIPINSGYFNYILINSGVPYTDNCGLTLGNNGYGGDAFFKTNAGSGIYIHGGNGSHDIIDSLGTQLTLKCGGASLIIREDSSYTGITASSPTQVKALDVGSISSFNDYPEGYFTAASGQISNKLVINSGEPYSEYCGLTLGIGNSYDGGDAFFKTHGGSGIYIHGDNGSHDKVESLGDYFHLKCGSTDVILRSSGVMGLPVDATSTQTVYDLVNAIKYLLIERGLATAI